MLDPQWQLQLAQDQQREMRQAVLNDRIAVQMRSRRGCVRWTARIVGNALLWLSTGLLRYGQAERPLILHVPSASDRRSVWN